ELELSLAVEGRHGDLRAERRLGHRQRHARIDVVALADEVAVRAHGDAHVDVAGAGTRRAGMALARDADALAVVNPGRGVDVERAPPDDTALAAALAARCLDHPARAAARRADGSAHELAEDAPRHLADPACAAARRAGADLRSRLGAVAVAARARDRDRDPH